MIGHVIYPLRYLPQQWQLTLDPYEEQLRALFQTLIQSGRGIELNTTQGHTIEEWTPVLQLYHSCGGEIITLGSDAHSTEQVGCKIRERQELLRECGFKYFCTFEKLRPVWQEL